MRGEYPTPVATRFYSSQNGTDHDRPSRGTPSLELWAKRWATPIATDAKASGRRDGNAHPGESLSDQVRQRWLWTTPQAADARRGARQTPRADTRGGQRDLVRDVSSWPTPTARDGKGAFTGHRHGGRDLPADASRFHQGPATEPAGKSGSADLSLNPRFVEALMGWPIDATDCESSVTASSPSKPPEPSES